MSEWVHTVSAWAIAHKDQLTLLATVASGVGAVVSAVAAFIVMALTKTLATDNRLLRKAGTEPEVVAYLLPDERHINILNLVVANVGRGPARNIELEFIGDRELLQKQGARLLQKPKLPILPWLPQDERFVQIFGNAFDLLDGVPPPEFKIQARFEDTTGKQRTTVSRINIAEFDGLSRIQGPEHEIAGALKLIAKTVEGWNGFTRLKVETISAAELPDGMVHIMIL